MPECQIQHTLSARGALAKYPVKVNHFTTNHNQLPDTVVEMLIFTSTTHLIEMFDFVIKYHIISLSLHPIISL